MIPLHSGHPGAEATVIVGLAAVVVGAVFALTRGGWSRVGALLGVGGLAVTVGFVIEALGLPGEGAVHLLSHGFELSAVVLFGLASYYALFDARTATPSEE